MRERGVREGFKKDTCRSSLLLVVVGHFYMSDISEYTSEDRYFDRNIVQTLPAKLAYKSLSKF